MANCCQNVRGNKTKQGPKRQQKQTNKQNKQTPQVALLQLGVTRNYVLQQEQEVKPKSKLAVVQKLTLFRTQSETERGRKFLGANKGVFFRARQLLEQQTAY